MDISPIMVTTHNYEIVEMRVHVGPYHPYQVQKPPQAPCAAVFTPVKFVGRLQPKKITRRRIS